MMYIAGVHWLYFPAGLLMIVAAAPFIWLKVFSNIQRDRILALFNPDNYPDEIWQQSQAANAIQAGGLGGSGLFKGEYTHSGLVPECENDMIFSVVCEEFGLIGAFLLLFVYCALAYKIIRTGKQSGSFTSQMMCYGVAFMIIAQVIVNIGMCLSLLPVIGITLPFISAGGSSTVCIYGAIGLVMSVYRSSHGIRLEDYSYAKLSKYSR
jgi:rod shape determining protein RodA